MGADGGIVQGSDIKNGIVEKGARGAGRYFQKRARPARKKEGKGGGSMWVRKENERKPISTSSASIFSSTDLKPTYGREADLTARFTALDPGPCLEL